MSTLRSSAAKLLAAAVALAMSNASSAWALTACTAAQITAQDSSCPATGACTITKFFTIGDLCVLDFTGRAVTIAASGTLDVTKFRATLKAGSLVVAPGGKIIGLEDCLLAGGATCPGTQPNPSWTIISGGIVDVQKAGSSVGSISIGTDWRGATIDITAAGNVTIAGEVKSNNTNSDGNGGDVKIFTNGGNITTSTGSTLGGKGGSGFASGGSVRLNASGRVDIANSIDVSGGSIGGGSLDVFAQQDVVLRGATTDGSADGDGGDVDVRAGTSVQILDHVTMRGGGQGAGGGAADITASFGDITISGNILGEGAAPDGTGGDQSFEAAGSITLNTGFTISSRGDGQEGDAGDISLEAGRNVTISGSFDASGGDSDGGDVSLTARGNVTIGGTINATGRVKFADGGSIVVLAGDDAVGSVTVSGLVDAGGGGCDATGDCGDGGSVEIEGCGVTVTSTGSVQARAGGGLGSITVTSHELMTVSGPINATKSNSAGTDGTVTLVHRTSQFTGSGTISPTPTHTVLAACTAAGQPPNCLTVCPTCGNGMVEYPETCDGGNAVSCDGCSLYCRTESCGDGNACTTDQCSPTIGCGFTRRQNGSSCPDGLVCNGNETCQSGLCTAGTNAPSGTTCNDSSLCTTSDQCNGSGSCVGAPVTCNDGNVCTTDGCNPATGCTTTNNTLPCNDSNACTTSDTCSAGSCVGGSPPNCNDGNVCTTDGCNPASGCTATPNTLPCNDSNACTTSDTCSGGSCVGGAPPDCNDSNVCTDDGCSPASGCTHTDNTAPCSDGFFCNGTDSCFGGTCNQHAGDPCTGGAACNANCNESSDTCFTPAGGGCTDDGNACTADQCDGSGTCSHTAISCDDGNPCTTDSCNPGTGCQHEGSCPLVPLVLVRTISAPLVQGYFGGSFATVDSSRVLIGAPFDYTSGMPAGAAYLYDVNTGALLQSYQNPAPEVNGLFGMSVAALGTNLLIGAPQNDVDALVDAGKAYVFSTSSGTPIATHLAPTPVTNAHFGYGVGALGTDLLVVQVKLPSEAYRIDSATGTVTATYTQPSPQDGKWGNFIKPVGTHVAVGDQELGKVFLFAATSGAFERVLAQPGIGYGFSGVASGTDLVLGGSASAAGTGSVDTYDPDDGSLLDSVANPHPTAGWWAFTIAIAGPRLLVNSSEGVDVYDHSTSTLIHTITSPETTSSGIGWAMTAIGNSVVFGAPFGDGAAYVYAPCGDGNQDPGEECDDTNTMGGDGCSATCQTE